ncbi:hypothetical protein FKW77_009547 [Venturia effusa]|uniref:Uncharacterized protein n=1 Tax=Venturia effusa TaxID=50376 RepID=A0A517LGH3_9PEZI|nr:hypothetical protein FKW77_009547 [Venturia effusa]
MDSLLSKDMGSDEEMTRNKEEEKEGPWSGESVAQKGDKKKAMFQTEVEDAPGVLAEEHIREEGCATPSVPPSSPEITKGLYGPADANVTARFTNSVPLSEGDYKELDIFWECSEAAPKRRASVLTSDRRRMEKERGLVLPPQTSVDLTGVESSKTATRMDETTQPVSPRLLFGSRTSSSRTDTVAVTSTSAEDIEPLSLEATTPTDMFITEAKLGLPRSRHRLKMDPRSLAMNAARAKIAIPLSSAAATSLSSGAETRTISQPVIDSEFATGTEDAANMEAVKHSEVPGSKNVALHSEVPGASNSEITAASQFAKSPEVNESSESSRPSRLGVRVWSHDKYMKTS